jgi:hypothetical protein
MAAQALQTAVELTEEMLCMARRAEWRLVAELEQRRRPLIRVAFDRPVPPPAADVAAALTRRLCGLNDELISLGERSRGAVSQALAELGRGRRAQAAYGQHGKT